MGGILSGPVSGDKKAQIKDLIEAVLKTFTLEYTKSYGIELLKKIKADVQAEPSTLQLSERPEPVKTLLKKGYLTKQCGLVKKSWKRMFVVVRHDYKIDCYQDEETFNKQGKPKETLSPCGYSVSHDLAKDLLARAQAVAEKMGVDTGSIPAVTKYPDFTLEIHHDRRKCHFIHAESEEEKGAWVKIFKECCRHCEGLNNPDPVAQAAFTAAIRRTRCELGRWGSWSFGGSEEQILSDLIVDELNCTMMGDIYLAIKGPSYGMRITIKNKVAQLMDTLVMAGVTPAFKAMEAAVTALRERIEKVIRDKIGPIFEAEKKIKDKIKDAVVGAITPVLTEKVAPHLAKILQILTSPVAQAFQESTKVFSQKVSQVAEKVKGNGFGDKMPGFFRFLDNAQHDANAMAAVRGKVDVMYEPLWALHQIFDDISPWTLIEQAHDQVKKTLDKAVYTFEKELEKEAEQTDVKGNGGAAEAAIMKVKASVEEKFAADASSATTDYYKDILLAVVFPFLLKLVNPVAKPLIQPVNDVIPDAFKEFIDLQEMFEGVIESILGDSIGKVIESATSS